MIQIKVYSGKINLTTDDPTVKCLLEFKQTKTAYIPWKKQWNKVETIDRIYDGTAKNGKPDKNGIYNFKIGLGWAAYIANIFQSQLSFDDYNNLLQSIKADSYRTVPFTGLREHQNSDVLHMLKYKIGLCTVNTGYGKLSLPHYVEIYNVNGAKTVEGEIPNTVLTVKISEGFTVV